MLRWHLESRLSVDRPGQAKKRLTSRCARGHNRTMEAGLGDNVDLNGRVAARVVDLTCVDFGDRHHVLYLMLEWQKKNTSAEQCYKHSHNGWVDFLVDRPTKNVAVGQRE